MSTTEKEPGLIGIHQSFAETDLSQTLSKQVRYERYKPEEVSNERWEDLLGADVNNLDHLPLTYGLTKVMIKHLNEDQPGTLNEHEENVLQAAALIHDWAESVVGDVTYSDKTTADTEEEMRQLASILDQHYAEDTTEVKDIILEAADNVVGSPESKLGKIFNTIERLGYVRTALRATHHLCKNEASDCEDGLRWLIADVLGNQIPVLLDRSRLYKPVRTYMDNQASAINQAFYLVKPSSFANFPVEQQRPKEAAFLEAWADWERWLCHPPLKLVT